jgi:hypothetical protein
VVDAASNSTSAAPKRVDAYWLNFTIADTNGNPLAAWPFQFYVTVNSTNEWEGLAQVPPIVTQGNNLNPFFGDPAVNYTAFRNTSAIFQSYLDRNGSRPDNAILYTGPPYYGPPDRHYYFLGGCGFPCIRLGSYVALNGSGIAFENAGWSFYYGGSDLVVSFLGNQPKYELQGLSITVNMTVTEEQGSSNTWVFHPYVEISGAPYTTVNASTGLTYVIRTGIGAGPTLWFYVTGGAVAIVASGVFLWSRRRSSGKHSQSLK